MIKIGTRRSLLALWQANFIRQQLELIAPDQQVELVHFTTQGDRQIDTPLASIGGKGVFTLDLEKALLSGEIDLAVHSLKDLPTDMNPAFTLGAIPKRGNPFDALISRSGAKLADLPQNAIIGTSSLRRSAQLKAFRPDFQIKPLRGNVDTRLKKALDPAGEYDAIVLAVAGLERLNQQDAITEELSPEIMLSAPGQGALGVQCRADDPAILALLKPLDDPLTRAHVTAERAFLHHLDAGCSLPVSAYATSENDLLQLTGRVSGFNGEQSITLQLEDKIESAQVLGIQLAEQALAEGAAELLAAIKGNHDSPEK